MHNTTLQNNKSNSAAEFVCSPRDFIDAVREMYDEWLKYEREKDSTLRGLPDFEKAMDYVENNGIGACPK